MLEFTREGNPAELPGLTLAYIGEAFMNCTCGGRC